MTVKKLIEKLQQCDPEATIMIMKDLNQYEDVDESFVRESEDIEIEEGFLDKYGFFETTYKKTFTKAILLK